LKLALALGGGAGLGWAHIGVLHALAARDVEIVAVSGTSIGALAAVCLAAHRVNVLEDLARSVNARGVMRFLDIDPRRGSVLGGRNITAQLRHHFGHGRLEDLFIPTALVAADLVTGNEVSLTHGLIVDAVRASIAIPGVLPPVRHGRMILVDGGVIAPVPVKAVRALSDAPVLAINLQGDYRRRAEIGMPPGKRIVTPFRVGRAGLSLLMMHLARQSLIVDPPDLEIAPAIGHIDVRNFTRANELIEIGEASVVENWASIEALFQRDTGGS
jgi:NTE family protein